MKKAQLKPLPQTDMMVKYALLLDSGMVKHYSVSLVSTMIDPKGLEGAVDQIKENIRREMGRPELEIEMLPQDPTFTITETVSSLAQDTFLALIDQATRTKYLAVKSNGTLYQYNENVPYSGSMPFLKPLADSPLLIKLRRWVYKICTKEFDTSNLPNMTLDESMHLRWEMQHEQYKTRFHRFISETLGNVISGLKMLAEQTYVRKAAPVFYLAVSFEEQEFPRALREIAEDLDIMTNKLSILGHAFKPLHVVPLVNQIGNGGKVLAILCSPIVDTGATFDVIGTTPKEINEKIKAMGVKHLAWEGDVTYLDGKIPYSRLLLGETKHIGAPVKVNDGSPIL